MDYLIELPQTNKGYNSIWVIVDRHWWGLHIQICNMHNISCIRLFYYTEFLLWLYLIETCNLCLTFGNCFKKWCVHNCDLAPRSICKLTNNQNILFRYWKICLVHMQWNWWKLGKKFTFNRVYIWQSLSIFDLSGTIWSIECKNGIGLRWDGLSQQK